MIRQLCKWSFICLAVLLTGFMSFSESSSLKMPKGYDYFIELMVEAASRDENGLPTRVVCIAQMENAPLEIKNSQVVPTKQAPGGKILEILTHDLDEALLIAEHTGDDEYRWLRVGYSLEERNFWIRDDECVRAYIYVDHVDLTPEKEDDLFVTYDIPAWRAVQYAVVYRDGRFQNLANLDASDDDYELPLLIGEGTEDVNDDGIPELIVHSPPTEEFESATYYMDISVPDHEREVPVKFAGN